MAGDLGATRDVQCYFMFPESDGGWRAIQGTMSAVDGHHHKILLPGLETRSGEGFGITLTYHVLQDLKPVGGKMIGKIAKNVVQNGRLMSVDVVAEEAEIIIEIQKA